MPFWKLTCSCTLKWWLCDPVRRMCAQKLEPSKCIRLRGILNSRSVRKYEYLCTEQKIAVFSCWYLMFIEMKRLLRDLSCYFVSLVCHLQKNCIEVGWPECCTCLNDVTVFSPELAAGLWIRLRYCWLGSSLLSDKIKCTDQMLKFGYW